ncbi:hypothetical protein CISIN_1g035771mg [Citrus sinensis]|uniref:Uncharacterized protein n=1 Tax=Citrus sinensis TaxID=2711 RepID=A0A067D1C5_CITSI|nr:hypothetical protein CISIN_1g035771mg [Citrus sinensis]
MRRNLWRRSLARRPPGRDESDRAEILVVERGEPESCINTLHPRRIACLYLFCLKSRRNHFRLRRLTVTEHKNNFNKEAHARILEAFNFGNSFSKCPSLVRATAGTCVISNGGFSKIIYRILN